MHIYIRPCTTNAHIRARRSQNPYSHCQAAGAADERVPEDTVVEAAQTRLRAAVDMAMVDCRRDLLWEYLRAGASGT